MKSKFFLFWTLCAVSLSLISGCSGYEHATIPTVQVNFSIRPDRIECPNLNYIGGHEYFTGGVKGIIVYRVDQSTFVAYDRACPHDWGIDDSRLVVDESGILIRHDTCGSVFNILDGSVISGPSRFPLKFYKTRYNGVKLRIYN